MTLFGKSAVLIAARAVLVSILVTGVAACTFLMMRGR
jgi:hypothetical protein